MLQKETKLRKPKRKHIGNKNINDINTLEERTWLLRSHDNTVRSSVAALQLSRSCARSWVQTLRD